MLYERKSRLTPRQQGRLIEYFVAGATARTAAGLMGIQPNTASAPACDSLSPNPAYQQRISYTSQVNSPVIGVRERINPLMDASLFKRFILRPGVSFEIRGEFFNILNTPNFGGPGTSIGSSTFGEVTKVQANDPRIGQLTARVNF